MEGIIIKQVLGIVRAQCHKRLERCNVQATGAQDGSQEQLLALGKACAFLEVIDSIDTFLKEYE